MSSEIELPDGCSFSLNSYAGAGAKMIQITGCDGFVQLDFEDCAELCYALRKFWLPLGDHRFAVTQDCQHDFAPLGSQYTKEVLSSTPSIMRSHDEQICYAMLFCKRCGETKEVIYSDRRPERVTA